MKDLAACALLGLVPSNYKINDTRNNSRKKRKTVPLKVLVDYALEGNTATRDQMTFDEFVTWHSTKMTETGPRTRLGPLMTELRLVAAVQFGIPPVLASMEITLIAEIERRHKIRYPQTDVSRRGPRGTVWYIIDSLWFTSWANLVKKTAGTAMDSQDGRGGINNPDRSRTMNRIRNASLLVDNGSLALRPDIRWKHDYEILPPLAWSALQGWYDGGPPIHRSVVKYVAMSSSSSPHSKQATNLMRGQIPTEFEIELYPLFVTVYLCDSASRGEAKPFQQHFQLSRVSPIMMMLVQLCRELDVRPDQARLWVIGNKPSDPNVTLLPSTIGEDSAKSNHGISSGDDWILGLDQSITEQVKRRGSSVTKDASIILLLELKDRDSGLWPRGIDGTDWAFQREKNATQASAAPTSGTSLAELGDGIVGLYNMG
jgi:DUSP domain